MDFNFILLFIESIYLQFDIFGGEGGRMMLGSDDPIIKGLIISMFAISGFGILLNLFNAGVRKKMIDQVKLKRIMISTILDNSVVFPTPGIPTITILLFSTK